VNYENIKTVLLTGLVIMSWVLTWQLWTFQLDYAVLDNENNYEELIRLEEERSMNEVIVPESMIVHGGDEEYYIVRPDLEQHKDFLATMSETTFIDDDMRVQHPFASAPTGIQLIYPTSIPSELFVHLFDVEDEDFLLPLTSINRIYFYVEPDEGVVAQLLSLFDEQVVTIKTDMSPSDLEALMEDTDDYMAATSIVMGMHQQSQYVPVDHTHLPTLSYTATMLSSMQFSQALFTDPSAVSMYHQSNGKDDSYTDGNRIISEQGGGNFMEYTNPVFSETTERSGRHIIQASFDFINSHGGWTDQYILDDWQSFGTRDLVSYRLRVNGFPVMSFQGEDLMKLDLVRRGSGNQPTEYRRPLFDIDNQPIDGGKKELPSGEEVLDALKEREDFNPRSLEKMVIGYEMVKPSYVIAEPFWFVKYDGRWEKIDLTAKEEVTDGLE
jgi:regulatory protein YycH of two-component signal transduction system YycFG